MERRHLALTCILNSKRNSSGGGVDFLFFPSVQILRVRIKFHCSQAARRRYPTNKGRLTTALHCAGRSQQEVSFNADVLGPCDFRRSTWSMPVHAAEFDKHRNAAGYLQYKRAENELTCSGSWSGDFGTVSLLLPGWRDSEANATVWNSPPDCCSASQLREQTASQHSIQPAHSAALRAEWVHEGHRHSWLPGNELGGWQTRLEWWYVEDQEAADPVAQPHLVPPVHRAELRHSPQEWRCLRNAQGGDEQRGQCVCHPGLLPAHLLRRQRLRQFPRRHLQVLLHPRATGQPGDHPVPNLWSAHLHRPQILPRLWMEGVWHSSSVHQRPGSGCTGLSLKYSEKKTVDLQLGFCLNLQRASSAVRIEMTVPLMIVSLLFLLSPFLGQIKLQIYVKLVVLSLEFVTLLLYSNRIAQFLGGASATPRLREFLWSAIKPYLNNRLQYDSWNSRSQQTASRSPPAFSCSPCREFEENCLLGANWRRMLSTAFRCVCIAFRLTNLVNKALCFLQTPEFDETISMDKGETGGRNYQQVGLNELRKISQWLTSGLERSLLSSARSSDGFHLGDLHIRISHFALTPNLFTTHSLILLPFRRLELFVK